MITELVASNCFKKRVCFDRSEGEKSVTYLDSNWKNLALEVIKREENSCVQKTR